LSFVLVFGVSFFEPLMLYPNILLTFYFIIASFAIFINRHSRSAFDGGGLSML